MKYESPVLVDLNAIHTDCDPVCNSNGSAVLTCNDGNSNQSWSCFSGTGNANTNINTQCVPGGSNAGYLCVAGANANNLCFNGGSDTLPPS